MPEVVYTCIRCSHTINDNKMCIEISNGKITFICNGCSQFIMPWLGLIMIKLCSPN